MWTCVEADDDFFKNVSEMSILLFAVVDDFLFFIFDIVKHNSKSKETIDSDDDDSE